MYYKKKFAGIYIITNKITEMYYIGLSVNITRRWNDHLNDLFFNKQSIKFVEDYNLYGLNSFKFEILDILDVDQIKNDTKLRGGKLKSHIRSKLIKMEREWMSKYSINFAYNKDKKYFK